MKELLRFLNLALVCNEHLIWLSDCIANCVINANPGYAPVTNHSCWEDEGSLGLLFKKPSHCFVVPPYNDAIVSY